MQRSRGERSDETDERRKRGRAGVWEEVRCTVEEEFGVGGEGRLLTGGQEIAFPFSHFPANLRNGRPEKAPGALG